MSQSLSVIADQSQAPPRPGAALPQAISSDGSLLTQLVSWWEEQEWSCRESREESRRDGRYYHGYQWTLEELEVLRRRGQPPLVINRIRRKINYLKGFERRLRSDPKAFPRTPADEQESDAATQALRYVVDDNAFDQIRSSVFEDMIIYGTGGAEVVAEAQDDGSVDIRAHHVPWDRLWWDPHSMRPNFTDARYLGIVLWGDLDEMRADYPDAVDVLEQTVNVAYGSVFDDRPGVTMWTDSQRKRVRVVQCHWKQNGNWWMATFTKGGFLEAPQMSPYIDRRGNSTCPLRMRSAYVDGENNRYGEVREYISPQDELNKRRSKALHILNMRQVVADEGTVKDPDQTRRELAKPDGWITLNPGQGRFEIRDNGDMAQGQMALLQHVAAEIDATGPNAAMAGKDPREQSGRAIQAQQQGGAVEQEPLIDSLRQWDREIYEAMWMRVRQFWTDHKWVRVTDDERNVKFVGLNRPVTLAEELAQMAPDQRAVEMQKMALQPNDPRLQMVIRVENDVQSLDVDITVEEGPDIATLQSETFNTLAQLASSGVAIPPEAIIKASPLRSEVKEQILDMMEQQKAQQAATAQSAQALAMAEAQAKLRATNAQADAQTATANERQVGAVQRLHEMAVDHAAAQVSPHTVGGALTPQDVPGMAMPAGPGGGPSAPVPQPAPLGMPLA
jgi:hypothetical protein